MERLAVASQRTRRRRRLRGTPAERLSLGHIDSLELLELLRDKPPRVIHDIGANIGTWTCLAKSLYPDAAVEAFEPLEVHLESFRKWTAPWQDVRLHHVALGPRNGTSAFEVTDFPDASSVLPLSDEGRRTFKIETTVRRDVYMATLDGLVGAGTVLAPDLLKLDVQGYELEVLRGAARSLQGARAVICEVSFRQFYEGQPLFSDVLAYMAARDFRLHAFGSSLLPGEPLVQADALFLKS